MIDFLRAGIRLILFFIISLPTVILVFIGNVISKIFNERWKVIWKNNVIRIWSWIIIQVIGLRVNIKGTLPESPYLLVSNHLSYIDPIIFWLYLDATFVAKSEIKSWPFFGWGAKALEILFIDRDTRQDVHRMNDRISEAISQNQGVILFPEGTSSKGAEVLPFNTSLLQYAIDNRSPVNFAAITYRTQKPWKAHVDVCWWGDMSFFDHFWKLLKMPVFEASVTFGDEAIMASDRKILAIKLREAVSRHFTPTFQETENNFQQK